jgi:phosphate transport system substrate-binding protein
MSWRLATLLTRKAARLALGVVALSLALGSCSPTPTPTPAPGPVPRVAVTPAFAPRVLAWAQAYLEELGPLPFDLEIVQAGVALEGLDQGEYVVAIGALKPQDGWFATPLARDPIAVVTGSGSGVSQVTRLALVDLLAGRTTRWSELGGRDLAVQPVLPLPGDDLRQVLDETLMLGKRFYSGSRLIATPAQALELLDEDPAAFALLPLSSLPAGRVPLRLDGVLPESAVGAPGTYALMAQVVAIAPSEPRGPVRDWLAWIQAVEG